MSSAPHDTEARRPALRLIGRAFVPDDETMIFDRRPSLWLVLLNAGPAVVSIGAAAIGLHLVVGLARYVLSGDSSAPGSVSSRLIWVTMVLASLVLVWAIFDWWCRRYVLTDRRAIVVFGILHQRLAELPLDRVQNVGVSKPLLPRVLGVGHVGLASAGTDGYEVVWRAVAGPDESVRAVRRAIDARRAAA